VQFDPTVGFDTESLIINKEDLRSEYAVMARDLKIWLDVLADVSDIKRALKLELSRTKRAVELAVRAGPTKVTDKAVEADVEQHPLVISKGDELLRAELIEDKVMAIVESLKTKRAMILGLGGLERTSREVDQFTS